jgi:hypothetical protein
MHMRAISVVSSALMVVGLAGEVCAQSQEPSVPSAPAPAASSSTGSTEQFGLNLARIQRGLQRSAERHVYVGLNLGYYVSGYAPAPSIRLFTREDNLSSGPAPYGGPTHGEMMQMVTPQEFRAPVADFTGIARWLANKAKK